jgi:23S rRNA (cytosine1962-C5)-methyltransferase
MSALRLKARADRRLRAGHVWVYSNEVDISQSPLKNFSPGQLVAVEDARGKPLGLAYVNPNTLICARLLTSDHQARIDAQWFDARLRSALTLRDTLFAKPYYRLVHGEADGLPGLIVDRFAGVLVCQFNTAGMDSLADEVLGSLIRLLQPQAIVLRNDTPARGLEGLVSNVQTVYGVLPETVLLEENGTEFAVPVLEGQKTGWFYDHRINRLAMQSLVADRTVLDVFSYIGGWGIQAATAGAREVTLLDSSAAALQMAMHNAERNGCQQRCAVMQGKALPSLKELHAAGRQFDVVVLDPPAFIKRRKDIAQGEIGYRRVNELALRLLRPGGFLISASCSMHLGTDRLQSIVAACARDRHRELKVLGLGYQGPDHPVHPVIAETAYLKALFCQVI